MIDTAVRGGQATEKAPHFMNIVATTLGKTFYYKILQVGVGPPPKTDPDGGGRL